MGEESAPYFWVRQGVAVSVIQVLKSRTEHLLQGVQGPLETGDSADANHDKQLEG